MLLHVYISLLRFSLQRLFTTPGTLQGPVLSLQNTNKSLGWGLVQQRDVDGSVTKANSISTSEQGSIICFLGAIEGERRRGLNQ